MTKQQSLQVQAGLGKGIAQRLANDGFNIVIQDINQKL